MESAEQKQALCPAQELCDQTLRDFLKKCEATSAQTMKSPVGSSKTGIMLADLVS